MKTTLLQKIDQNQSLLSEIAHFIGTNPELGHQEFLASARLMTEFKQQGFQVERNILNLPTAFIATYASAKPGPIIALLCEYDALTDLGHACGHHLISTM
ncbi:MAG: amidohydrolase, partial [Gorillibacterium sp.]|nr:amidohydrolase [Gorillibacterium sp.]